MTSVERYVPVGNKSLTNDAPGWNSTVEKVEKEAGPICWKCKGQRKVIVKKRKRLSKKLKTKAIPSKNLKEERTTQVISESGDAFKKCPVCDGKGFMASKKKEMLSLSSHPGMITRKRKSPDGWRCSGPISHAVDQMEKLKKEELGLVNAKASRDPIFFLHQANTIDANNEGITVPSIEYDDYPWYPSKMGEQLCNLVGNWRILQRVGSHRWTTDDIMTAKIAIQQIIKEGTIESNQPLRYLDLGCGNGSVLQMVAWGLLNKIDLKAYGIEARSEAAGLARRSLSFNIGKHNIGKSISVIHGDFRDLERGNPFESTAGDNKPDHLDDFYQTKSLKFDLVTGTPPYFQVDFNTKDISNGKSKFDRIVTSAIINQGGMPTSIQSAPARCEFRGGIEEYCRAAATVLSDDGVFVVCENWLNNGRVHEGAKSAGLKVMKVYPVKGKEGRKENLFGVYVLKKGSTMNFNDNEDYIVAEPLSVRTKCGKWTLKYAALLETMAIPASHLTD